MRTASLTIALTSLLWAAPAAASTVSVEGEVLRFHGDPGEQNVVSVRHGPEPASFVVADTNAWLRPGPGCRPAGDGAAECSAVRSIRVALGDGDDGLGDTSGLRSGDILVDGGPGQDSLHGAWLMRGGEGDDTLSGGAGADALFGEEGDDVLSGGAGDDLLDGGAGRDDLWGGVPIQRAADLNDCGSYGRRGPVCAAHGEVDPASGSDTLRGGEGFDSVSYSARAQGVVVDLLVPGGDGAPGEGDSVAPDVEMVFGTPYDDVLRGAEGDDVLHGFAGRDHLVGRAGADSLYADSPGDYGARETGSADSSDLLEGGAGNDALWSEAGHDRLHGDDGDDRFQVSDRRLSVRDVVGITYDDLLDCGRGSDHGYAGASDRPSADCEGILVMPGGRLHPQLVARRAVEIDVRCGTAAHGACTGRAVLRGRGVRVRRPVKVAASARRRVVLSLPRRARRVLRARRGLRVRTAVTLRDRRGRVFRTARVQVLRPR